MSTKTKNTQVNDPLFSALESRFIKQDAATRANRVRTLMEALESQITGAAVLPANAAAQAPASIDLGKDAVGQRGIFWDGDAFYCGYSGACIEFSDGRYQDSDGDWYDHFLSVESSIPEAFR